MKKWLAFATLPLIYGSGFMFADIALQQVSPLELSVYRLSIGLVFLTGLLGITRGRVPMDGRILRSLFIISLANITIPFLLISWAQQQSIESGLAGVLVATNPLFSLILAHFVFDDERMTFPKVLGVTAGFAGAIILASRTWQDGQLMIEGLLGYGAVIFSAFLFAASAVYSRRVMQREINPLSLSVGTSGLALISNAILLFLSLITGHPLTDFDTLERETLLSIFVLGFSNSFIAFALIYYVIRELGATRTSTITYIIPLISLALGSIFLDEIIDERVIIGTMVILSGVVIVTLQPETVRRYFFRQPKTI